MELPIFDRYGRTQKLDGFFFGHGHPTTVIFDGGTFRVDSVDLQRTVGFYAGDSCCGQKTQCQGLWWFLMGKDVLSDL